MGECRREGELMIARLRPWRRRDDGASAVEFAILVPVLLIITFGILAVGLLLFGQISATHAAREAARRLAVNDSTLTNCTALKTYLTGKSGFTPSSFTVAPASAKVGDQVTVKVTFKTDGTTVGALASISSIFPGGAVVFPKTITVSADSRVEEVGPITTTGCP
jgi:Flp pilus assembly protein TadG